MGQLFGQNYWGGVCGFVSVIHGILLSKNDGNALDGLTQNELEWNLGMSILAFLKYIKNNNKPVADNLVNFTRTFGGVHAQKTMDQLILECDRALAKVKMSPLSAKDKVTEQGWGIAMSKEALLAYIAWIGAKATEVPHNGVWSQASLSNFKNCVCGVGDINNKDNGFLGLRHWVYINDAGYMYNWGSKTKMGNEASFPYEDFPNHNYLVHVLRLS